MTPQFVAAKIVHSPVEGIMVGVYDENYEIADWIIEDDLAAARITAANKSEQYGVPIAKITEKLLNI